MRTLNGAKEEMKTKVDCSSVSVVSGGELFLRFITLASEELEQEDNFDNARALMLRRGETFLNRLMKARMKIAKLAEPFLKDGSVRHIFSRGGRKSKLTFLQRILVHSHSKCVLSALHEAHEKGRRLQVYVTENSQDKSGQATYRYLKKMCGKIDICIFFHRSVMHKSLTQLGIPSTLILDAAVGHVMAGKKVDYVLMGAEDVVESGGVVNKIGSYSIAMCAKHLNTPVYVLCESFKFVRLYPLGQDDLPDEFKVVSTQVVTCSNNYKFTGKLFCTLFPELQK